MIEFFSKNVDKIFAAALILIVAYLIINAIMTRRFFRRQFRKSIESLSLPALLDEMTTNQKKYQQLTERMMEELNDKQLLEALYYHLLALAKKRNRQVEELVFEEEGSKRIAGILVIAQQAFRMTGFVDSFQYTPRLLDREVANAYQTVGAKRCAKVLRKVSENDLASSDALTPTIRAQLRSYDEALHWYHKTE